MASAVFFPGPTASLLHRSQLADLFIDIEQLIAQFPKAPSLGDLALRFGQAGGRGKGFGDGLGLLASMGRIRQSALRSQAAMVGVCRLTGQSFLNFCPAGMFWSC